MSKYKIIVATHKKYEMPVDDLYLPVYVGAAGKHDIGYQRDDEGINISKENSNFCELTGVYWAYKNLKADYWGIVHYRRYFRKKASKSRDGLNGILDTADLNELFEKHDIVLPKKQCYFIETIYSHYAHTHNEQDLILTRDILSKKYPEYVEAWDTVMQRKSAHMFNMFIMKNQYAQEYCDWMFSILFELKKKIDLSQYDAFQARLFGRISEFLLDVWLEKNHLDYVEMPVIFMGKIDWPRKIRSFLNAKFRGEKYNESF